MVLLGAGRGPPYPLSRGVVTWPPDRTLGLSNSRYGRPSGKGSWSTRKVRCVIPAPSITLVFSSSIGSAPWSNNGRLPKEDGHQVEVYLVKKPDLEALLHQVPAPHADVLVTRGRFRLPTALSRPSVTNVKGDPSLTHSCGTELVRTKTGTPKGCPPPHPWVRSNVLRPDTNAPVVRRVSARYSAVCGETMNTISVQAACIRCRQPMYQAKSRSPPTPIGASGPSFGPAINPSSDIACPVRTFPMASIICPSVAACNSSVRGLEMRECSPMSLDGPRFRRRTRAARDYRPGTAGPRVGKLLVGGETDEADLPGRHHNSPRNAGRRDHPRSHPGMGVADAR